MRRGGPTAVTSPKVGEESTVLILEGFWWFSRLKAPAEKPIRGASSSLLGVMAKSCPHRRSRSTYDGAVSVLRPTPSGRVLNSESPYMSVPVVIVQGRPVLANTPAARLYTLLGLNIAYIPTRLRRSKLAFDHSSF